MKKMFLLNVLLIMTVALFGQTDEDLIKKTITDSYVIGIHNGGTIAKEAGRVPSVKTECKFLNIDITGNAAMAKIELHREGKLIFTDYLFLYKFKDSWKIVNKIYFRH